MPKFTSQKPSPSPVVVAAAASKAPRSYVYPVANGATYTTTTNMAAGDDQNVIAYHPAYSSGAIPAGRLS